LCVLDLLPRIFFGASNDLKDPPRCSSIFMNGSYRVDVH
jgi:hypothetical protein